MAAAAADVVAGVVAADAVRVAVDELVGVVVGRRGDHWKGR